MEWDIFDEIFRMQEEMNKMFNDFMYPSRLLGPGTGRNGELAQVPSERKAFMDMQETDKDIIVTAELPGVNKEDIMVNVTPERVEIRVEKKEEQKEEKEGYRVYGSRYSGFYRNIPLHTAVDSENVKATYKNGILEITLPKKEVATSQNITVD
ncbi:MAG: Hsp20/alpha crystallin family protein [Theionarchaea archaeon]|nr:Hsp20/alpha crystallin family protein [Theionarchaea archaeon]